MASLLDVRTDIYTNINRTSSTAMDAVVDLNINSACSLLGLTLSSIYEEEYWFRTFTSDDNTNNVDNFSLPATTKLIRQADLVDTSTAGEEVYYPLLQISPDDLYDTDKLEGYRTANIGYTTVTRDITSESGVWNFNTFRRGGLSTIGRSSREGRPEMISRVGNNVYIHPYITSDYVGWKLRLLLVMYPDVLTADEHTNTVTNNYPYALVHFASGLIWASHFHDQNRAQAEFSIAAQFLGSIASDDQIKKLINIQSKIVG